MNLLQKGGEIMDLKDKPQKIGKHFEKLTTEELEQNLINTSINDCSDLNNWVVLNSINKSVIIKELLLALDESIDKFNELNHIQEYNYLNDKYSGLINISNEVLKLT